MIIVKLPCPRGSNQNNPYLEKLRNYRRAKDYLIQVMFLLNIGLRDLGVICGYEGETEFQLFLKRFFFRKGNGRLLTKSDKFTAEWQLLQNHLRRKSNEDFFQKELEFSKRLQN